MWHKILANINKCWLKLKVNDIKMHRLQQYLSKFVLSMVKSQNSIAVSKQTKPIHASLEIKRIAS